MKIVFATGNKNKLKEAQEILGAEFELVSLEEIGILEDIPETADTLAGNALLKAQYVWEKTALACFADDTGLEVDYLNGAPGVYSARYAGENKSFLDNINKLLTELDGVPEKDRSARFKCVIALIIDGKETSFEGKVEGRISELPSGNGGFGYDPIFIAEGFELSFSEISSEQKHAISHRGEAMKKLADFLKGISRS